MEYIVFFAALMILIGSISIAMPSKSSKEISKVRMEAKLLGCRVVSILYGKNEFKNKDSLSVSYQIKNMTYLKEAHFIRDKDELILYSPLKLKYSDDYNEIQNELKNLSPHVLEIIFSNASISFIWKENKGLDELIKINSLLKNF